MGQDAFDEIMAENSLNLIKEAYPGTASTKGLKQDEPSRPTPKYTIIKMTKVKENSKVRKRKTKSQLQGSPHRLISLQKICKPEYTFGNIYSEF